MTQDVIDRLKGQVRLTEQLVRHQTAQRLGHLCEKCLVEAHVDRAITLLEHYSLPEEASEWEDDDDGNIVDDRLERHLADLARLRLQRESEAIEPEARHEVDTRSISEDAGLPSDHRLIREELQHHAAILGWSQLAAELQEIDRLLWSQTPELVVTNDHAKEWPEQAAVAWRKVEVGGHEEIEDETQSFTLDVKRNEDRSASTENFDAGTPLEGDEQPNVEAYHHGRIEQAEPEQRAETDFAVSTNTGDTLESVDEEALLIDHDDVIRESDQADLPTPRDQSVEEGVSRTPEPETELAPESEPDLPDIRGELAAEYAQRLEPLALTTVSALPLEPDVRDVQLEDDEVKRRRFAEALREERATSVRRMRMLAAEVQRQRLVEFEISDREAASLRANGMPALPSLRKDQAPEPFRKVLPGTARTPLSQIRVYAPKGRSVEQADGYRALREEEERRRRQYQAGGLTRSTVLHSSGTSSVPSQRGPAQAAAKSTVRPAPLPAPVRRTAETKAKSELSNETSARRMGCDGCAGGLCGSCGIGAEQDTAQVEQRAVQAKQLASDGLEFTMAVPSRS